MSRKIFNGLAITPLTEKEIQKIRDSSFVDEIIKGYYEFIPVTNEKVDGKGMIVSVLDNGNKDKVPSDKLPSQYWNLNKVSAKGSDLNLFEHMALQIQDVSVSSSGTDTVAYFEMGVA